MKLIDIKPDGWDKDDTYVCDNCKETFKGTEVILEEAASNIAFHGMMKPKVIIDIDNDITYYLACPKCKEVSLFGFDKVV